MAEMIELTSVSRWYGEVIGLNDVSIAIPTGLVGLLGPNGAGKSTLMRMLTGQIQPNLGKIKVFGENPWNNPSLFKRIGYCQESEALYTHMTGMQFLVAIATLRGMSQRDARDQAESVLVKLGLQDALHRTIGGYSKGMRQRTKVAQALLGDPELLILDEPLNGTDPLGRKLILDIIRERGNAGQSVLLSSHVLHEVEQVTDTVLMIHHGRILAGGRIHEIREALEDVPHKISLTCDPVRSLAAAMMDKDYILGVELTATENRLQLLTTQPTKFFEELPQLLMERNITLHSMENTDDSLEAVFQYLVK